MSVPSVSIIMPVYNAETTLKASIESVRRQSHADWQLILVNDGSTDRSHKIALSSAAADHRIQLYHQKNGGPSRARNLGIEHAASPFVAFLDADDRWAPDRLRQMLEKFKLAPEVGVLFSRTQFIDAATGQNGTITRYRDQLNPTDLLAENPVCSTSNIICRRSVLDRVGYFREGLDYAEDQDWLLRVALDAHYKICGTNAVSFFYASAPDSQSSDLEAMHAGWLKMTDHAAQFHAETIGRLKPYAYAQFLRHLARRALRMRRGQMALSYLSQALSSHPSLILKQPKRTGLTLIGALLSRTRIRHLEELAAQ